MTEFEPFSTKANASPIFIIGSPRSGTTLLRVMLDSHDNISCGPETHFLIPLRQLADRHRRHFERFGEGQAEVDARVRDFFESVQVDYMNRRGRQRWAEKTPGYTLHLEYIHRLFPTAQFLHIVRDGRDVVASHRHRWGYRSAVRATRVWPLHVRTAQGFGTTLPKEQYYELRYEDLVAAPEESMRAVLTFLREPWDPEILRFDERPHDADRFAEFTASRRAASGETAAIYKSRVGSGAEELDPLLQALLRVRAGRVLSSLGYA